MSGRNVSTANSVHVWKIQRESLYDNKHKDKMKPFMSSAHTRHNNKHTETKLGPGLPGGQFKKQSNSLRQR